MAIALAWGRRASAASVLAGSLLAAAAPALEPAAGDARALLAAAEQGRPLATGRVVAVRALDRSGRVAELRLEAQPAAEPVAGSVLHVAWEELAPARPDRFRPGDRVLVALAPLPGNTLWRRRLPQADARLVAGSGRAFLREPDAPTRRGLARWLALAPSEREEARGVASLAELVAEAEPGVAGAAVARLGRIAGLPARLEPALPALSRALGDPTRPTELRRALCGLVERRRLQALRPAVARLADDRADPVRPDALVALAALDGGLGEARTTALLESRSAALRTAAVRGGGLDDAQIEALLVHDPAPEVRIAALDVLLERQGERAFPAARRALFDRDPKLRERAIRGIGAMGPVVVPELETLAVRERDPESVRAPLAALALAGPEGRAGLARISREHETERVRALARLMLGLEPVPGH